MLLTLKNIGKIRNASVKIEGITVIAGENNTGKSTVGKVLYSIFNSFYKIEEQIIKERAVNIRRVLELELRKNISMAYRNIDIEEFAYSLISNSEKYKADEQILEKDLYDFSRDIELDNHQPLKPAVLKKIKSRIQQILNIAEDDILMTIFSNKVENEFNGQVNNIYDETEGIIELTIRNEKTTITIIDNIVESISRQFSLGTEAVYIDDPFVLDEQRGSILFYRDSNYLDHRNHLKSKLFQSNPDTSAIAEIITSNKLENIYSKLNTIVSGDVVKSKRNYGYKKEGTEKILDIKNISAGLKTFVILKTLLKNGTLEENGTLILDEPEIHLHPQWQLLFAELIVLIQKEFNMHILLNTHSPYFLNAIEVYASKYNIYNKCNYYISELHDEIAELRDVTDEIDVIYRKLARPLQDLENERYEND